MAVAYGNLKAQEKLPGPGSYDLLQPGTHVGGKFSRAPRPLELGVNEDINFAAAVNKVCRQQCRQNVLILLKYCVRIMRRSGSSHLLGLTVPMGILWIN